MDIFFLLILIALAFPVAAIAALVVALNARTEMRSLQLRIAALENAGPAAAPRPIAQAPAAPSAPAAKPVAEAVTPPPAVETPAPAAAVEPPAAPPQPAPATPTLEQRFGTQWVVWAGGIALALL